jgi:hypothetical protein
LQNSSGIQFLFFNNTDVQRHNLVKNILNIYQYPSSVEKKMEPKKRKTTKPPTEIKSENVSSVPEEIVKSTLIVTDKENNQTLSNNEKEDKKDKKDNDCALIPKNHRSKNFNDYGSDISANYYKGY